MTTDERGAVRPSPSSPTPPPSSAGARAALSRLTSSPTSGLLIVAVAVVLVAALAAPTLYDGAWFFYTTVDRQQITIPQARTTFGLLLWPLVLASQVTDDLGALRFAFGLPLTIAPLVALVTSWWIVRRSAPSLMVWPALGVLLVNLPGQTHWVATSIRTNQLVWPVLMAVLVGLPDRTLPLVAVLLLAVANLHPQAAVYLLFVAVVCLVMAQQRPEQRTRLRWAGAVFVAFALYRAGVIAPGYETDQASSRTQLAQWRQSVLGAPLLFLTATFGSAILLLLSRHRPATARWATPAIGIALAFAAAVMLRWAWDPAQWRDAIQYRGPSLPHGLALMAVAVADRLLMLRGGDGDEVSSERLDRTRLGVANAAALIFAVVVSVQAAGAFVQRSGIAEEIAAHPVGCVPYSAVPSLEGSPLDFWSTPALSLLLLGPAPDRILLPDAACEEAVRTRNIPVTTLGNRDFVRSRHIDHSALIDAVEEQHPCRVRFGPGWHETAASPSGAQHRASAAMATLEIDVHDDVLLRLRGAIWGIETDDPVVIRPPGGEEATTITFEDQPFASLTGRTVAVPAGSHHLRFETTAGQGFALLDLGASIDDGATACWVEPG